MWSQIAMAVIGLWLFVSPFVFPHDGPYDGVMGFSIAVLALLSMGRKMDVLRLFLAVLALWLIVSGYISSPHPRIPQAQNHMIVGILILMLSVIPRRSNRPPDILPRY